MDSASEGGGGNWFCDEPFSVLESSIVPAKAGTVIAFLQGRAEADFVVGDDDDFAG